MSSSREMLAAARARIARHSPAEARAADAVIVDLRSNDEREREGIIPGSVHVPRSVLEWRFDGGFEAWRAAGLPVVAAPPPGDGLAGMGGPQ